VMLSSYQEAQGDFDAAVRTLLASPRSVSGLAISRLHARLLWCQLDDSDLYPLRDHALVPAVDQVLSAPNPDPAIREAVLSLLAVVPTPFTSNVPATTAWTALQAKIDKAGPKVAKLLKDRRDAAARQRALPPPALRSRNFCSVPDDSPEPESGSPG